jgi:hypothetical protein
MNAKAKDEQTTAAPGDKGETTRTTTTPKGRGGEMEIGIPKGARGEAEAPSRELQK